MTMEEHCYPRWSDLLPEALALIFTKLPFRDKLSPSFPLVCKPWSKVVASPYCWQDIDFTTIFNDLLFVDDYEYGRVKKRSCFLKFCGESLRILKIRGAYLWRDVTTFEISVAEKLSCDHLDISCCIIEPSAIRAIGNHCKNLKRLDRNLVFVTDDSKDEDAFAIASSMPRLKHFEIAYTSVTTKGVFKILSSCPYLQYLDISECFNLTHSYNLFNHFYPGLKIVVDNFVDIVT
ncbi:hypothetical protein G4B88_026923 [Cannabis sativa]|uniref:F-box domain-containing protein n=1 Tax=Cannabis sativa TaxID=3483 RepID=A0A7J6EGT0_CANSA|nr:hypothetical protein G4B88_026923 [Cannabis sativa]